MVKRKQDYCPNKEYWFGFGDEAQAKPAACRFKRGALLKPKISLLSSTNQNNEAGREVTISPSLGLNQITENTVVLLINYDCYSEQKTVLANITALVNSSAAAKITTKKVDVVTHVFTFLHGERMGTVKLTVWGRNYETNHNDMWHKARKPRKLPQKKQKPRGKGFSFEDVE